jgi:hypothetical protein
MLHLEEIHNITISSALVKSRWDNPPSMVGL